MSEAFLNVVNMSISAGWLVLAVLALRLILKKAPKWVNVLLWGIVAVRLICPFSIESALSLIPSQETISPEIMTDWTPEISTGIAPLDQAVNPVISTSFAPSPGASANPLQMLIPVAANLWLLGVLIMLAYTAISYLSLRRKLRTAVILRGNIFQCETVSSPFVLGILKPRIYLPYTMDGQNLRHVVAHEQAHIRRKDHWWKPLGFLLLTVHWFNPLMWAAYILLCRDIELACDEKVIAALGNEQRADYTQALVACSVNRRMIAACPLAFGEVGVKERVKSVLNYKKPTFWIIATALVVCVVVAVCFLTNPKDIKTPMHIIDTLFAEDVQWSQITIWEDESAHVVLTDEQIQDLMGILKDLDDRDFIRSRDIEGNVSLMINCGEIELLLHWDGEYIAFYFDSATHELIDNEYCYVKCEELNLFLSHFYPIQVGTSRPEVKWFDYTKDPSNMSYERELKIRLDDFPGITFKYTPYGIIAVTDTSNGNDNDEISLISGMPILNAYFCDLTGDGLPEICSQVSFGSGICDMHVVIYDYAKSIRYELWDRGYHDYYLRMDGAYLYVDKRVYNSDEVVSSGRLVFKDGSIQIEGEPAAPVSILRAKILEVHDGYFLVEPVEGSPELLSANKIEVPIRNMSPSPEPQVGDILNIEYDGQIQETYPARLNKVYHIALEQTKYYSSSMIPTDTDILGCPSGALLIPIDGNVYRYELSEGNPVGLTVDELLYTFTEETHIEGIVWEVYSLKEYPDKTAVLMLSGTNSAWLCKYSPPQRCEDTALADAIDAGYVILEDGIATHGQDIWKEFYERTQQGKAASVTVVHYFTLDPQRCDSAYYEVYSQDYPCLYECYLEYDGKTFTLTEPDGNNVRIRNFEYLMKYDNSEFYSQSSKTPGRRFDYVLTHDHQVTWEQIWNGLVSSYTGAEIDHYSIYSEREY